MAKRKSIRDRNCEALLVSDLDEETLEAIRTAQPSEESVRLNYLMDDLEERSDESSSTSAPD